MRWLGGNTAHHERLGSDEEFPDHQELDGQISNGDFAGTNSTSTTLTVYYDDKCSCKRAAVGTGVMLGLAGIFLTVLLSRGFSRGESTMTHSNLTSLLESTCVSSPTCQQWCVSATEGPPTPVVLQPKTVTQTTTVTATVTATPEPLEPTVEIEKSVNDNREFRYLELPNKLKVLMVSDSQATYSSAAMGVGCGSFDDSKDVPGLAHLTEHMLFLGNTKYPEENTLDKFLSTKGAETTNAFTTEENTVYYYSVPNEYFGESLDQFLWMFKEPLLWPNATAKEIGKVNSEYEKDLNENVRKMNALLQMRAAQGHPYGRFHIGNTESLVTVPNVEGINLADRLKTFYTTCYGAANMHLVIQSKSSLDQMSQWVQGFSVLREGEGFKRHSLPIPFEQSVMGSQIDAKPIGDTRQIVLVWPLPRQAANYTTRPTDYIATLLGHESKGSLLYTLKEKGWATGVTAGGETFRDFSLFTVTATLTEAGQQHASEVIYLVYDYLAMVRASGIPQYIFDEIKATQECIWKYPARTKVIDFVKNTASVLALGHVPPKHVLVPPSYWIFDQQLINGTLHLLQPHNMLSIVFDPSPNKTFHATEKWFHTPYNITAYSPEEISSLQSATNRAGFSLPPKNTFLCNASKLSVLPPQPVPVRALHTTTNGGLTVWHHQDTTFASSQAAVYVRLSFPKNATLTVAGRNLTVPSDRLHELLMLTAQAANEAAWDQIYLAATAQYTAKMEGQSNYLQMSVSGFSDHVQDVATSLLSPLTATQIDQHSYRVALEARKTEVSSFLFDKAYTQGQRQLLRILANDIIGPQEKLKMLESITAAELEEFRKQIAWIGLYVETLTVGNMLKDGAISLAQSIRADLPSKLANQEPAHYIHPVANVRPGGDAPPIITVRFNNTNVDDLQTAVVCYLQSGVLDIRTHTLTMLVSQTTRADAYNALRTEGSLDAYVAALYPQPLGHYDGIAVVVQAERHPQVIQNEITQFLQRTQLKRLKAMNDTEFDKYKSALADYMRRGYQSLKEEVDGLWAEITFTSAGLEPIFDRVAKQLAVLDAITKKEFLEFYSTLVHSFVSIQVLSQKAVYSPPDLALEPSGVLLNETDFRQLFTYSVPA